MLPDMAHQQFTRRKVATDSSGALTSGLVLGGFPAAMAAQSAAGPPTTVLINAGALRKRDPQEIAALLQAVAKFVENHNGGMNLGAGHLGLPDLLPRIKIRRTKVRAGPTRAGRTGSRQAQSPVVPLWDFAHSEGWTV